MFPRYWRPSRHGERLKRDNRPVHRDPFPTPTFGVIWAGQSCPEAVLAWPPISSNFYPTGLSNCRACAVVWTGGVSWGLHAYRSQKRRPGDQRCRHRVAGASSAAVLVYTPAGSLESGFLRSIGLFSELAVLD